MDWNKITLTAEDAELALEYHPEEYDELVEAMRYAIEELQWCETEIRRRAALQKTRMMLQDMVKDGSPDDG